MICEPICKKLRKTSHREWDETCQKAFITVKEYLIIHQFCNYQRRTCCCCFINNNKNCNGDNASPQKGRKKKMSYVSKKPRLWGTVHLDREDVPSPCIGYQEVKAPCAQQQSQGCSQSGSIGKSYVLTHSIWKDFEVDDSVLWIPFGVPNIKINKRKKSIEFLGWPSLKSRGRKLWSSKWRYPLSRT